MKGIIRKHIGLSGIAALWIVVSGGPVYAENAAVDERLEALDQKVKVLERKLELAQETEAAKGKEAAVVSAGKDGFFLKSADGSYQLKVGGYIQTDGRFFLDDKDDKFKDSFLLRRVRLNIEGTLARDFDFRLLPDFGEGKTVLQDAYVGYKYTPELRLRTGKFKEPFGLERLQSGTDTLFVERALPTNLGPNRDIGLQLFGDLFDRTVSYAIGIFNGVSDGGSSDGDNNDQKDIVGRIFVQPFKKGEIGLLEGLGIGVAASRGDRDGSISGTTITSYLPSYKTPGQQTFFSYRSSSTAPTTANTVLADGNNKRFSPQAYYYWHSLGLLGEYISSSQDVKIGSSEEEIKNDAWEATASYVLTGENASYKGVKPKGAYGAVEIVGRVSELDIDDDAFPTFADPAKSAKSAKSKGIGFNWYVNRNIRVSADYEVTKFDGGASGGKDRDDEKVILSRVQAVF